MAIAAILALQPQILVMDEPTGELDPESSREIYELLRKMNREKGITVIVVEQKIMLQCEYVDRLIIMEKGRVVFDGTTLEAVENMDFLKEKGINLPRVSELGVKLKRRGLFEGNIPVGIEEAEKRVRKVTSNE